VSTVSDVAKHAAKQYKEDTIMTVGVQVNDPTRLPTGIFSLDLATGGGIPLQRISLLYGKEDSMKTSIALKLIASAQRMFPKKAAVLVDVEQVFSESWAKTLGVDLESLVLIRPANAEQVVDMVEGVLNAEDCSIVVIDSLAAFVTQHELEKSAEDAIVGRTGIVVNKLYRKVTQALGNCRRDGREPTLVVINQIRFKIGGMGNPEVLPGGPSFAFGSSLTIRFYGKDIMETAVSKTLPAYKEVSLIVKKHKIPILAKNAVMQIALQPIPEYGLKIGEAYDWNTLRAYLKSMELLTSVDKKWQLVHPGTGEIEVFKKQDDLKDKVYADPNYGQALKSALIAAMMNSTEIME
jgi:protein RecA